MNGFFRLFALLGWFCSRELWLWKQITRVGGRCALCQLILLFQGMAKEEEGTGTHLMFWLLSDHEKSYPGRNGRPKKAKSKTHLFNVSKRLGLGDVKNKLLAYHASQSVSLVANLLAATHGRLVGHCNITRDSSSLLVLHFTVKLRACFFSIIFRIYVCWNL